MKKTAENICYSKRERERESSNLKNGKRVAYHATPTIDFNKLHNFVGTRRALSEKTIKGEVCLDPKKDSAITLIALVITIIVLLILAGITLTFVLGENGLFSKARNAKTATLQAQAEEDIRLKILEYQTANNGTEPTLKQLATYLDEKTTEEYDVILKNNSTSTLKNNSVLSSIDNSTNEIYVTKTSIGAEVKVTSTLQVEATNKVETASSSGTSSESSSSGSGSSGGSQGTPATTGSNVTMVTVNTGETVPVPSGFYYVGGDLSTGVVISDSSSDNNKYANDTNKDVGTDLAGNQFVWIPCTTSNYKKTDWGEEYGEWDTTTPKSELIQIEKYGGFYVGRYEAGLASTISEFTTNQTDSGSNMSYIYNLSGIPQCKAGLVPWDFIDWSHAKTNSESMYNTNQVSSGLITGTQWDVMLNTLISKTSLTNSDITNSDSWGNHNNVELSYTGRKASGYWSSIKWEMEPFGSEETSTKGTNSNYYGELLTTGASSTAEKYHIFDIAGNLWEWTEEDSFYATSGLYRMIRGGCFLNSSIEGSSCMRCYGAITDSVLDYGFRVVLYIK